MPRTFLIALVLLALLLSIADLNALAQAMEENRLPGCLEKGGRTVFTPGECPSQFEKMAIEGKKDPLSKHGGRLICCVPDKGVSYMNGKPDCQKAEGYMVGLGGHVEKMHCESGDEVIGIMTGYADGYYICCRQKKVSPAK